MSTKDWVSLVIGTAAMLAMLIFCAVYLITAKRVDNYNYAQKEKLIHTYRVWLDEACREAEEEVESAPARVALADDESVVVCECGALISIEKVGIHSEVCPVVF